LILEKVENLIVLNAKFAKQFTKRLILSYLMTM